MSKVVIGIIDDGIAFAHERFRDRADKTRVAYAWLQAVPTGGIYLDKPRIDVLFNNCTHDGFLDEEEFYRRAGWINFGRQRHCSAAFRAAHGTHVMDLACGYPPQEHREDRPIICVQLPAEVTADTGHATHSKYPLDAVRYILDRADQIAQDAGVDYLPVVINFSYGAIAGAHDGRSIFEAQLDQIVALRKARFGPLALEIVLPAGNSHLSRCHAEISFQRIDETKTLHWRVQPDNRAQSFLEFWAPCRTVGDIPRRLEITVVSPTGESYTLGEVPGQSVRWLTVGGAVCAQLMYGLPTAAGRGLFLLALQPTADLDPSNPIAPAGVWKIELKNKGLRAGETVHAWIERGDTPFGYPLRGRQSYFDEDCYERYDHGGRENEFYDPNCRVVRRSLINSIATGGAPIVIGGLLRKEMVVAPYSAGGPVLAPCGIAQADPYRPDAVTVSDDSRIHRGILAAGTRSGSVVAIDGTSVAAPQIARKIADLLAQGLQGGRVEVRNLASPPPVADPRYGAGAIFVQPSTRSILDTVPPRPRFIED